MWPLPTASWADTHAPSADRPVDSICRLSGLSDSTQNLGTPPLATTPQRECQHAVSPQGASRGTGIQTYAVSTELPHPTPPLLTARGGGAGYYHSQALSRRHPPSMGAAPLLTEPAVILGEGMRPPPPASRAISPLPSPS